MPLAQLYIGKGGDINLQTNINIPGMKVPVHAEQVHDSLARMVTAWSDYYAILVREFGLPTVKE